MTKLSSGPTSISPRILCVSLGSIGKRHLRNTRTLLPQAHIAVYRQHTTGAELPDDADVLIADPRQALAYAPDAVLISSPASEHVANALPFIERHTPVFLEKPLAASNAQLGDLVSRCAASRGFVMVGYVLRFLPALHALRQHLQNGLVGTVHTARIEVGQYLPDWRPGGDYRHNVSGQRKLGGGALLELSHEIDYTTWLFGWPSSLLCSCAHLSALDIDVEDSAHMVMEYADKRISVQLDFLQRVANMAVQVVGSKGTLTADLIKEELRLIDGDHPQGLRLETPRLPNGNDIYMRQFDFFFSRALPGYTPLYPETRTFADWASVQSAEMVLRIVDLAKRASETGARQVVTEGAGP